MTDFELPGTPWAQTQEEILAQLDVAEEEGLGEEEVSRRRRRFGRNRLRETKRRSAWQILLEQFQSLVVLLLVAASAISFAFGEWVDGVAILAVVLINAAIGFFTELRAVRSMEALQEIGNVRAKVRRDGEAREVEADELVPGDVIILESGDVVTADLRLVEAAKLQANESALTGESVPVDKQAEPVDEETPLAERASMVFKGTAITRGSGLAVAVQTGMETELGEISALVEEAEQEQTPLEERLDQLGRKLIVVTLVITTIVAIIGIVQGRDPFQMVETAIALAVAAIPEGLPIVATIALARGMRRMAQRNALVNRLAAVETLGGTNVICTDKTGTLTENQMTLTQMALTIGEIEVSGEGLERNGTFRRDGSELAVEEHDVLRRALEVGVLCNNAALPESESKDVIGDPVETALLVAGAKAGLRRDELLQEMPESREVAFDPDIKMMATFHKENGHFQVAVKGAPEAVLNACVRQRTNSGTEELDGDSREKWLVRNREMAGSGLRMLAIAEKESEEETDPYQELTFLGLLGLLDPPREEVQEAMQACQQAGIRVVMVTGDQAATARKVALAVGLAQSEEEAEVMEGREISDPNQMSDEERARILEMLILTRVSPKQKLDLIEIYQKQGLTVAMTGDGVNDAPALKKASIGIAMGRRGTEVARQAADMVLQDDAFSTIAVAVEQGRTIFNNIRKFVIYLLSCNISEILTVGLASLLALPLPILPLQILFLNLVTDVFPALALGVGEADPEVMQRPPRHPKEAIVMRRHWYTIVGYGLMITFAVLGSLGLAQEWLGLSRQQAVTVSFLTLASAQLWHVFNMRDVDTSLWRNEITANKYVWGALALCGVLLLGATYVPVLSDVLKTTPPPLSGWLLILGMSILPTIVGQMLKFFGVGEISTIRYQSESS